ncbi:hypothetical protein BDB01DRAFT_390448 [Pilobolus umbonatus]|nr:hypothetical protein BDB01DRAFT_390448 [Pilobolus umbonatus]
MAPMSVVDIALVVGVTTTGVSPFLAQPCERFILIWNPASSINIQFLIKSISLISHALIHSSLLDLVDSELRSVGSLRVILKLMLHSVTTNRSF